MNKQYFCTILFQQILFRRNNIPNGISSFVSYVISEIFYCYLINRIIFGESYTHFYLTKKYFTSTINEERKKHNQNRYFGKIGCFYKRKYRNSVELPKIDRLIRLFIYFAILFASKKDICYEKYSVYMN